MENAIATMNQEIEVRAELARNHEIEIKSPVLSRLTDEIEKAYAPAADKAVSSVLKARESYLVGVRKACMLLAEVKKSEAYKTDGFKSASDYALRVWGMESKKASQWFTFGAALNAPNCPDEVKRMTPANYAQISALGVEGVKKAIEAGEIGAESTQAELKAYTKAKREAEAKPKVLKRYNVSIPALKKDVPGVTEAEVDETMGGFADSTVVLSMKVDKEAESDVEKRKVYVDTVTGIGYVATFYRINEQTTKTAKESVERAAMRKRMQDMGMSEETIAKILGN